MAVCRLCINNKIVNRINKIVHKKTVHYWNRHGLYLMSETGIKMTTCIGYTQEMIRRIAEVLQAVFLDVIKRVNRLLQVNCLQKTKSVVNISHKDIYSPSIVSCS